MSNADPSGFGTFVPGFEFLQNLARQATGGLTQGLQQAVPQLPNLGSWVAPTFNVEDLEKRIQELKAVQFWLDQNTRALSATIQALEVQKMTLSTLQDMNLNLGDVANALKVNATDTMATMAGFAGMATQAAAAASQPAPSPAPAPAPEPAPEPKSPANGADAAAAPAIDPMQWWGALTQQFQAIATSALAEAGQHAAALVPNPSTLKSSAAAGPRASQASAKSTAATAAKAAGKTSGKRNNSKAASQVSGAAAKAPAKASAKVPAKKATAKRAGPTR